MRKGIALLAISFVLVIAYAPICFAKPPEGISIAVQAGYDGIVHLGRVNPVRIDLGNNSKGLNLSGELSIECDGVDYATRLDLPAPSSKRLFLYVPFGDYSPFLKLHIRTKAYSDEFVISEPKGFKSIPPEDTSVLVITDQKGCLGVLNNVSAARLYRNLYRFERAETGAGKIHPAYAALSEIDPTPKYLAQADIIVIAGIDYAQVTAQLAEALKAAAAGGTSLVFSLGLDGSSVGNSELGELCPLAATGSTQISELGQFGESYGFKDGTKATIATGKLRPGARTLASSSGHPMVMQARWGAATSTALAFDITQVPFKQSPGVEKLIRDKVLPIDANIGTRIWFSHPSLASQPLGFLVQAQPMSPGFVLLFLLSYTALIGPLNFFLLDRFKRRTLVWTTIPLLIGAFSYTGLNTGYIYRGSDNVQSCIQEVHIFPGAAYMPYQAEVLVFTSNGGSYKLPVRDQSAVIYPSIPTLSSAYFPQPAASTAFTAFKGKVDSSAEPLITTSQGKWTSRTLMHQGFLKLEASAASNLSLGHSGAGKAEVQGTYSLDLPFDLQQCSLAAPGVFERVGDLAGKGTYSAADRFPESAPDQNNYLYKHAESVRSAQESASHFAVQYAGECLLSGLTDKLPSLVEFPQEHLSYSLSLVVIHLPCKMDVSPDGTLHVARDLLTGGSGFLAEQQQYNTYMREEDYGGGRSFQLQKGSYITVQYLIAGKLDSGSRLSIHLNAEDPIKHQPIKDVSSILAVEAWDGKAWREVKLPQGDPSLYARLEDLVDSQRQVTLRFKSLGDIRLQWPEATAY